MSIDERALGEVIEESHDLHSDAMRTSRDSLRELVDLGRSRPRPAATGRRTVLRRGAGLGAGLVAASGLGTAILGAIATPAVADEATDISTLQTAASIENLAVATYQAALGLPFMGGVPDVVKTFAMTTMKQHADHAKAFNAAATQLGGKAQNAPDPVLLDVVNKAKPTLKSPLDVVNLALELEIGAAQTYVANTASLQDVSARKVTASIMGVEAQHASILMAVKALLEANAPQLIALPPPVDQLPAAAGSVGFPDPFYKTEKARPAEEGAVK